MKLYHHLTALAVTVGLLGLSGPIMAQDSITLTVEQMRALTVQEFEAGNLPAAERLARALLERDAADRAGLLVLSQLALLADEPAAARRFAARLFRAEDVGAGRYQAARLTAFAAAEQGRFGLAGLWLRRALIHAGAEAEVAQTIADSRAMRDQNPWTTNVSFTFAPSDNVNGGSEGAFNIIDGFPVVGTLSPDARALSGWSGSIDLRAGYRLAERPRFRTEVTAQLYARGVLLSQNARDFIASEQDADDAPITNADFASGIVEAGLTHLMAVRGGTAKLSLDLGRNWSGTDDAFGYLRLTGTRSFALGETAGLTFQAFGETRWESGEATDQRRGLQATWRGVVGPQTIGATLGWSETLSDNLNAANTAWTVQVDWDPDWRIGPVALSAGLGLQHTDFPDYRLFFPVAGGRQDERVFANLNLAFPQVSYAGFSPVVTFGYDATDSNVSRFTRDGISVNFGLRSTF